jgi:nicotinamidase-related amidase
VVGAQRRSDAAVRAGFTYALSNGFGVVPGVTILSMRSRTSGDRARLRSHDILITKHRWGVFTGSDLDDQLRRRGITQVVIGGVSTSIGVETTARSAYELGYHVVLAVDAMLDRDPICHEHSIARIFPRLGETSTADAIQAALEENAPH